MTYHGKAAQKHIIFVISNKKQINSKNACSLYAKLAVRPCRHTQNRKKCLWNTSVTNGKSDEVRTIITTE